MNDIPLGWKLITCRCGEDLAVVNDRTPLEWRLQHRCKSDLSIDSHYVIVGHS